MKSSSALLLLFLSAASTVSTVSGESPQPSNTASEIKTEQPVVHPEQLQALQQTEHEEPRTLQQQREELWSQLKRELGAVVFLGGGRLLTMLVFTGFFVTSMFVLSPLFVKCGRTISYLDYMGDDGGFNSRTICVVACLFGTCFFALQSRLQKVSYRLFALPHLQSGSILDDCLGVIWAIFDSFAVFLMLPLIEKSTSLLPTKVSLRNGDGDISEEAWVFWASLAIVCIAPSTLRHPLRTLYRLYRLRGPAEPVAAAVAESVPAPAQPA